MVTDREPQPRARTGQRPELPGAEPRDDDEEEPPGGESACWARLVCPECGAMTTEGHHPGCTADPPGQPGQPAF